MSRALPVIGLILAPTLVPVAGPAAAATTPRRAAGALVERLRRQARRANDLPFAASRVAGRRGLGPSQEIDVASLTPAGDPDFAVVGCGAGDTICLSVISDVGGRWHPVPFEYGYGRSVEVNGVPAGHLVETRVNACGCAGGPSTFLYERYRAGAFRPTRPPGRRVRCRASGLAFAADPAEVQNLHRRLLRRLVRLGAAHRARRGRLRPRRLAVPQPPRDHRRRRRLARRLTACDVRPVAFRRPGVLESVVGKSNHARRLLSHGC